MLMTIHTDAPGITIRVNRETGKPIQKPKAIIDYVQKMGGANLSNQIVQYYYVLRKSVKWWKKLYFHLFNLLVVNAYVLYKKFGEGTQIRNLIEVINTLI